MFMWRRLKEPGKRVSCIICDIRAQLDNDEPLKEDSEMSYNPAFLTRIADARKKLQIRRYLRIAA